MKQTLAAIVAIAALTLLLLLPSSLSSAGVDIEIGASAGYNLWEPSWSNGKIVIYPPNMFKLVDSNAPTYGPLGFATYGPNLSVRFMERWEISSSFRYGFVRTDGMSPALFPDLHYRRLAYSIKQHDIHTGLAYFLFDMMKLFVGMRAEITDFTVKYRQIRMSPPENPFQTTMEGRTIHFTPELGVGVVVPISTIFGMLGSLSGTFQSGSDKSEYKNSFSLSGPELGMQRIPTGRYHALGLNAALSLRCAIPLINTTISIGGYYRLLHYMQKSSREGIYSLNGSLDHLLGCSASISYHFSIGKNKVRRVWVPRPRYDRPHH